MGNLRMNADQISYKGGEKPMSVEEAIKNAGNTGLAHTADIAPDFSTESAYSVGDYVYHNGTLYVFTSNHAAGAWSTDDTQVVTVGGELVDVKSGLNSKVPFSIVTSGSLHDIKQSGIYYITGGVSDRPMDGGGMYIVSVHNNDLLVGIYVGFLKDNQNRQIQLVSLTGGNWIVADIASTQRT